MHREVARASPEMNSHAGGENVLPIRSIACTFLKENNTRGHGGVRVFFAFVCPYEAHRNFTGFSPSSSFSPLLLTLEETSRKRAVAPFIIVGNGLCTPAETGVRCDR